MRSLTLPKGPILHSESGSGTEIRTPNLAVNRSLPPVQKWRSEFAECRRLPPNVTICYPRCCTTPAGRTENSRLRSRVDGFVDNVLDKLVPQFAATLYPIAGRLEEPHVPHGSRRPVDQAPHPNRTGSMAPDRSLQVTEQRERFVASSDHIGSTPPPSSNTSK